MSERPNDKPTHGLTLISPARTPGGKDTFTTLCPVWLTKTGEGFTAEIPAGLTVSGRILIQPRKERAGEATA